ncbi:OprD family outer membrane porin [Pseudomonas sp. GM41(2012)]|uniref:OprD family outer membrane porin n=1 Tax=Pseudomonas sp. (strain GM41(2012)) TaxID=1144708 RepID=UPI003FCF3B16
MVRRIDRYLPATICQPHPQPARGRLDSELSPLIYRLKNLSVRWRNSNVRRGFSANEFDENRIFINYPISLL